MTTKERLEELFDDNENYIHSYTGTPMIDTEKIVPKILTLMQPNSDSQPNGSKPDVSGSLPTLEDAWNAGVDEGGSRTGNFEWGIRRKDIEFSEWYAAELEYRSSGQ